MRFLIANIISRYNFKSNEKIKNQARKSREHEIRNGPKKEKNISKRTWKIIFTCKLMNDLIKKICFPDNCQFKPRHKTIETQKYSSYHYNISKLKFFVIIGT